MEWNKLMCTRNSCREYSDQQITAAQLKALLQAITGDSESRRNAIETEETRVAGMKQQLESLEKKNSTLPKSKVNVSADGFFNAFDTALPTISDIISV